MSDVSQGPGWWQASDGKWYPPADTDQPGPGWWLASDGNWYPPETRSSTDPGGRTPVKPVAKRAATPATRPATAAMGTPPGPAVAPVRPPAAPTRGPAPATPSTAATTTPSATSKPATPAPTGPTATSSAGSGAAPKAKAKATPKVKATPKATPNPKPAAAAPKGPNAAPATSPAARTADATAGAPVLSPDEQIRARNEQSRRDAAVLFGARKSAATRALGNISALLEQEKAAPARELRESGPARAAAAGPATAAPAPDPTARPAGSPAAPAPPPAAKTKGKLGRVATPDPDAATPPTVVAPTPAHTEEPPPAAAVSEPPLLEVKQGTLSADIEHIGERLVIFNDRVELHDRNDRVRQVIAGADIADVVVHKKFTGSTVTVEAGTGESIVAKGLKPEQADEIRSVILKRTRAGSSSEAATSPVAPSTNAPETPTTSGRPSRTEPRETIVDARDPKPADRRADLLAKLNDLHRAGVLSDSELSEKQALVERLVNGEPLAVSTPSA